MLSQSALWVGLQETSIPKTLPSTLHFLHETGLSDSNTKSYMQVSTRSGCWTVKTLSKAWADIISTSCLALLWLNTWSELQRTPRERKAATVKHKSLITTFPHWQLVRLRQASRKDGYFLKALREAEKLFRTANAEKCVQGRVFPFTGHDLNLM